MMTLHREVADGIFDVWRGEPIPTPLKRLGQPREVELDGVMVEVRDIEIYIDDVTHSPEIERVWTDDELAIVGLFRAVPAVPSARNHRVLSSSVQRVDGVVRWVNETEEVSVDERKADMLTALANRRWRAETGGLVFGAMRVPTDRDTQGRVDQIVKAYADGDLTDAVSFKMPFGFVELGEAELRAIKRAGAVHIQSCFKREADLAALIAVAADHQALDTIDINAGWPVEE